MQGVEANRAAKCTPSLALPPSGGGWREAPEGVNPFSTPIRKKRAGGFPRFFLASFLPAAVLLIGCQQPKPLPEQGSYAQRLYAERCGGCHRAYNPESMTAAMWEVQVEAMRAKIIQAGQPPLSPEQHLAILDYLKRNSGKQ